MSRISLSIPLDQPGRHFGSYRIPHSDSTQPYGHFGPIAVLANGGGPTLVLTGGVHGDEYPGPVAIMRLAHELQLEQLTGRLILLPCLNAPAFRIAERCSPLDGGNLNRAFPGDPDGGPTAMIADWFEGTILPLADAAIDFHAGGKVTDYEPLTMINRGPEGLFERNLELAKAFGVDLVWVLGALNDNRSVNSAAERARVPMMACELGGKGDIEPEMTQTALDGALGVMRQIGLLHDGKPVRPCTPRLVEATDPACSHFAPHGGLFDPLYDWGVEVSKGELAGWVRDPFEMQRPPTPVHFALSGHVAIRCSRPLVRAGDLLYGLVTDIDGGKAG